MYKMTALGAVAMTLTASSILFVGCVPMGSNTGVTSVTSSGATLGQVNSPLDGNYDVQITNAPTTSLNLGMSVTSNFTLAVGAYAGTVDLTVDNTAIAATDTQRQISFVVSPSKIVASPNMTYSFTVTTTTTASAPDLKSSYLVLATEEAPTARMTQVTTSLTVSPIYTFTVNSGDAKNAVLWSNAVINPTTGIATKQTLNFIAHAGGVTLQFINKDIKGEHIIHGDGDCVHQSTTVFLRSILPGANNSATDSYLPGDIYQYTVTDTNANAQGGYYIHDLGSSDDPQGTINFNVNGTTIIPTPVDAADATFTNVNNTILKPMCVSCHTTGNPSGGVDLSSYAAVVSSTVKYQPFSSALFSSVTTGGMPDGGTALSSTNINLIEDWIIDGVPNN